MTNEQEGVTALKPLGEVDRAGFVSISRWPREPRIGEGGAVAGRLAPSPHSQGNKGLGDGAEMHVCACVSSRGHMRVHVFGMGLSYGYRERAVFDFAWATEMRRCR